MLIVPFVLPPTIISYLLAFVFHIPTTHSNYLNASRATAAEEELAKKSLLFRETSADGSNKGVAATLTVISREVPSSSSSLLLLCVTSFDVWLPVLLLVVKVAKVGTVIEWKAVVDDEDAPGPDTE